MSATLTYFPLNGRAFATRAALRYAKVKFNDNRVKFPVFKEELKLDSKKCPLGSLPVLEIEGHDGAFCQSLAIVRWAAKKSDLYPKDDIEALAVDEILDSVNELNGKAPQHADPETKKKLREEFSVTVLPVYLKYFQSRVERNAGPFILGKQFTIADITLYAGLHAIITGDWDYVPKDIVEKDYPALFKYYQMIKTHPAIVAEVEAKI